MKDGATALLQSWSDPPRHITTPSTKIFGRDPNRDCRYAYPEKAVLDTTFAFATCQLYYPSQPAPRDDSCNNMSMSSLNGMINTGCLLTTFTTASLARHGKGAYIFVTVILQKQIKQGANPDSQTIIERDFNHTRHIFLVHISAMLITSSSPAENADRVV